MKISQLARQATSQLTEKRATQCSKNLPQLTEQGKAWLAKWENPSDFTKQFSATNWPYAISNPSKAYLADCPTLQDYDKTYGEGCGAQWVHTQMMALFGLSSSKDASVAKGMMLFAASFANEVKTYKVSELLLFFARYAAGKYDSSYSTFDMKRIGNAFFSQFVKERAIEIDKAIRENEAIEREKQTFTPPKGYTSWSWYQELKKRAEAGDIDAKTMISSKNY